MTPALALVVDDDVKSRRLVRDVLEHLGCRVAEAASGDAGVRLARELQPALIVMDIRLPGLDGIAALREIRADSATRAIAVVAVTASAMPRDRLEIRGAGFDGYHEKPLDLAGFLLTVRALLARRTGSGAEEA